VYVGTEYDGITDVDGMSGRRKDGMNGIVGVQQRVKDLASTYVLCPRLTDKYVFLFKDDGRTEYDGDGNGRK
jgi:hypothetical protein